MSTYIQFRSVHYNDALCVFGYLAQLHLGGKHAGALRSGG